METNFTKIDLRSLTRAELESLVLELQRKGSQPGGFGITQDKKTEEQLLIRTEELAAANKELESFTYSVSHNLRNPLNNIKAMCTVLKIEFEKKPDNDGSIAVGYISKSVDHMANIISNLLELSIISCRALKTGEVNLSEIAGEIIDELKKSQPSREVEVIIEDNMVVEADHGLIQLALENLIRNAWKYTLKSQNARIGIGVVNKDRHPIYFVRDNGTGFDMKDAQRIFVAFERAHKDEEYRGNGVGLAIVQRIVDKHGGKVWADSETGKGATFYFTLDVLGSAS